MNQHPGTVDAPVQKRTREEIAADKEKAELAKKTKAEEKQRKGRRIAQVEVNMEKDDELIEQERVTHPTRQRIQRTYAALDVCAINNEDAIGLAQDNNEDPEDDVSSQHDDNGSALTDVPTDVEEVPQKRGKKSKVSTERQAIEKYKKDVDQAPAGRGLKKPDVTKKQECDGRSGKAEAPAKAKGGKTTFVFCHISSYLVL